MNTSQGQGSSNSNNSKRLNKIKVSMPTSLRFGTSLSSFNAPISKIELNSASNSLTAQKQNEPNTKETIEKISRLNIDR